MGNTVRVLVEVDTHWCVFFLEDTVPVLPTTFLQGAISLTNIEMTAQATVDHIHKIICLASELAPDGELAS